MGLKEFENFLDTLSYSENTKKTYLSYYRKVIGHGNLNRDKIEELCRTYNNGVFRAFLKLLLGSYIRDDDKALKLLMLIPKMRGRRKKRLPKWLEPSNLNLLFRAATLEVRLIILLGFYSGLRISEILSMTPENLMTKTIIGKGNKEERIYINRMTEEKLLDYIRRHNIFKTEKIFKSTRYSIYGKLRRLGLRILGRNVSPHMLRHSAGRYLMSKGMDIAEIKGFLRHSDISSTQIYSSATNEEVESKWKEIMET